MIVKKTFTVDLELKQTTSNKEFRVIEGDTGNVIQITLTDEGSALDLTGCRVIAVFSKTNGTSMQDSGVENGGITIGGTYNNQISISLFPASFAPGLVECELQIYSDDSMSTLVTTAKYNFYCDRAIFNADTIQATNEYPLLVELIQTVDGFVEVEAERVEAESARIAAEEARADAEAVRAEDESLRNEAEAERDAAETERIEQEAIREQAEAERRAEHDKWAAVDAVATTLGGGEQATATLTEVNGHKRFELGIPAGRGGIITEIAAGFYAMSVNADGHLILTVNDGEEPPPLSISEDGHLIYTID